MAATPRLALTNHHRVSLGDRRRQDSESPMLSEMPLSLSGVAAGLDIGGCYSSLDGVGGEGSEIVPGCGMGGGGGSGSDAGREHRDGKGSAGNDDEDVLPP